MATEAQARLVWEVWRLTHECAGGFSPSWEGLPGNVRVWFMGTAMPLIATAAHGEKAHRAVMDTAIPEGSPFTVADVQPFTLLPRVTRSAWECMTAVAAEVTDITPHVAGAFSA